ncbi:type VI secretion protein, partial [Streptomyces sp. CLV115]
MAGRADQRTGGNGGGTGGGIPDGMLIGLLALLLGLTLLVWTATGLAGLFAHGAWPEGVTLAESPLSVRRLVTAPHDLPAAWPNTPAGELSGYGLFWGLFIGELMVLLVLTVFVLGVVARWRAVRARQRAERYGDGADEYAYEDEPVRARRRQEPRRRARRDDTAVPLEHSPAETAPLPRTETTPVVETAPGPRAEPTTATAASTGTGTGPLTGTE